MPSPRFQESDVLLGESSGTTAFDAKRRTPWKPRCLVICSCLLNALFIISSAAALSFAIFFDGFLLSLWPDLFITMMALFAMLLGVGLVGLTATCSRYSLVSIVLFCTLMVGQLACGSAALYLAIDEGRDLESISGAWEESIAEGGRAEQRVCRVQELFHCSGWDSLCPPDPVNRTFLDHMETAISAPVEDASASLGNTTDAPSRNPYCPICVEQDTFTKTCRETIKREIKDALPAVYGAFAAHGVVSIAAVAALFLARAYNPRVRESDAYTQASRFL